MFMVQTSAGCPGMSGATYLASKRQVSGACSNARARANAEDEPMDDPLPPFKSVAYAGRASGPRLIVTGAVHGNEVCGTRAIERVGAELDAGALDRKSTRLNSSHHSIS